MIPDNTPATFTRDKFDLAWVSPKTGQILDDADVKRLEGQEKAKEESKNAPVKWSMPKYWKGKKL